MAIRIIIADPHNVVLRGLEAILGRLPNIEILAACCNGVEALRKIRMLKPDIAVLEGEMPLMGGLDVLGVVNCEKLPTRIVFLSESFEDQFLRAAFRGGALGLVLKDATDDDYAICLTQVAKGLNWMSTKLQNQLVVYSKDPSADLPMPMRALTVREREVANMVQLGLSNEQIAKKLNVTKGTIKIHVHNIFRKAGVPNRTSLAAKISSNGK